MSPYAGLDRNPAPACGIPSRPPPLPAAVARLSAENSTASSCSLSPDPARHKANHVLVAYARRAGGRPGAGGHGGDAPRNGDRSFDLRDIRGIGGAEELFTPLWSASDAPDADARSGSDSPLPIRPASQRGASGGAPPPPAGAPPRPESSGTLPGASWEEEPRVARYTGAEIRP